MATNLPITFQNFKDGFDSAPVQANKRITFSLEYILTLYAQVIHETGNFNSQTYHNNWNLFGMRTSLERPIAWQVPPAGTKINTVLFMHPEYNDFEYRNMIKQYIANGTWSVSPYAWYSNWLYSLIDRILWDEWNSIVFVSVGQYMDAVMGKGYATDPAYRAKWVTTLNTLCDTLGLPRVYVDDANFDLPVQPTEVNPVIVTGFKPNWIAYLIGFFALRKFF